MEADVERVALAITQEIGWGTFSHFNPDDVRRISRAAIAALRSPADVDLREALEACVSAIGDWSRPTGANGMTMPSKTHPLNVAAAKARAALSSGESQ